MKKTLLFIAFCCFLAGNASSQTTDPGPYCLPVFSQPGNTAVIDSIVFDPSFTDFNVSGVTKFEGSDYVYFNNLTPYTFTAGMNYLFRTIGFTNANNSLTAIWVDVNHNDSFDSNERLQAIYDFYGGYVIHIPFTIPANSKNGITRMRICLTNGSADPCPAVGSPTIGQMGEYEDYNINIVGGVSSAVAPVANEVFNIYPNPASESVKITIPSDIKNARIFIFDMLGRKVMEQNIDGTDQFSVASLPPSTYLLKVCNNNEIIKNIKLTVRR